MTPATITVMNNSNLNIAGSLLNAVANSASGGTINFSPTMMGGQTITLTAQTGEIAIGKNLTIDGTTSGVTISGNSATRIFEITSGTCTINNLTLTNGQVSDLNGGAILVDTGATLNVNFDDFTSNSAVLRTKVGNGGAIADVGTLTVSFCDFTSNSAATSGGAIFASGGGVLNNGTLTVDGSAFEGNSSPYGGAIATTVPTDLGLDGFGDTSGNTASVNGGAIDVVGGSESQGLNGTLDISGCTFGSSTSFNSATGGSGEAIWTNATLYLETSSFTGNTASAAGGAIEDAANSSTAPLTINETTFTSNSTSATSGGSGGAVDGSFNGNVAIQITNSTFYYNSAFANGGGVNLVVNANQLTTFTNDTFFQNDCGFQNASGGTGGGLQVTLSANAAGVTSTVTLTSLTVYDNEATSSNGGGGVYISGNASLGGVVKAVLTNNIIDGNDVTASGYTGALDFADPGVSTFTEKFNLVGTSDTMFTGMGDIQDNTTGLATSLASNGAKSGYPETLALSTNKANSPGYETGYQSLAGQIDERGLTRQANKVSIGAEDPDAM